MQEAKTLPRSDWSWRCRAQVGKYKAGEPVDFSAARVQGSVRESLQRLALDYLDMVHCHDIEFAEDMKQVGCTPRQKASHVRRGVRGMESSRCMSVVVWSWQRLPLAPGLLLLLPLQCCTAAAAEQQTDEEQLAFTVDAVGCCPPGSKHGSCLV